MKLNKQGKRVKKQEYTKVAAVAVIRLPEDIDKENPVVDLANPDEKAAHFKGVYLLISNRHDAPEEAVNAYAKRWKIEVFYRNAKQEISKRNSLQVYFDTTVAKYASFFNKFWPKFYDLGFGLSSFHFMG